MLPSATPSRRSELDWLRVFGMGLVFVIHAAEPFNPWDEWHVVDPARSKWLGEVIVLLAPWIMPLFMVLAGMSAAYALRRRTNGQYLRERALRVLLPLAVGVLVIVPPQIWLMRRQRGEFGGSLLAFYPHFFEGLYPSGNFGWLHLWFLGFLIIFAVVTLPLFRLLERSGGRRFMERLARACDRPFGLLLFAVPLIVLRALVVELLPASTAIVADWSDRTLLLPIFIYGFILAAEPAFAGIIDRQWRRLVAPALAFSAGMAVWVWPGYVLARLPRPGSPSYALLWTAYTVGSWCWVMLALGAARRFLQRTGAFLEWARAAVGPFYILHQTVIVAVAYVVVRWPVPVAARFLLVLGIALALTVALYELLRRWGPARAALGMKPPDESGYSRPASPAMPAAPAAPTAPGAR